MSFLPPPQDPGLFLILKQASRQAGKAEFLSWEENEPYRYSQACTVLPSPLLGSAGLEVGLRAHASSLGSAGRRERPLVRDVDVDSKMRLSHKRE